MTEKQKKFLELMNRMLPRMNELEQEKLLAFGEGMAFMCGARGGIGQPRTQKGAAQSSA